jgi:formylglycine-generating enzyme required for sulfatase activity/energy-coupling factor transporter ATP-binding protein EcfA2
MTNLPSSGSIEAGRDIYAQNLITGIQQNFTLIFQQPFQPPADLARLRRDYLGYLRDRYRYLDMKGIQQVQQVTQQLSLAAVYVPLKARAQSAGAGELMGRIAGRWLRLPAGQTEAAEPDLAAAALAHERGPVLIEEALKTDPAVVVLGDPGAGKSTLLKVLALALAEQPEGPLPILLPLNAYADRLQQGQINVDRYLAEYYAARQQKLSRVGDLFAAALARQQAVILLDGLDEVQVERAYLVGLLQDFAAEHIPQPFTGSEGQPTTVVQGNRMVITSRIVGYEEAPLAGRQWRSYTLTDFDQADIEQFVGQWTLAFAVSVQGKSEAAGQAAERERSELLEAITSRPSVRRLASNPLLLTILALIKYTGVSLPEQRVELYELYLKTLIESWNLARSLDQRPVGPGLKYSETSQILARLALWLRQENPTAGLVGRDQLEAWLARDYREEWGLSRGEARQRAIDFLAGVKTYTNLLLERGERQYGFLHLTLEEMLAAKGIALLADDDLAAAQSLICQHLLTPEWYETLQLTIGVIALINQRPKTAGAMLQEILARPVEAEANGRPVIFAGDALLDVGPANVSRPAAQSVIEALVAAMQSTACPIHTRRDAGRLLGRLGWRPEPEEDDLLVAPAGREPTGLDAFRPVEGPNGLVWLGKYPVTNSQFARFVEAGGYDQPDYWSETGWAWRSGGYDSKAPKEYQDWLKNRPPEKRNRPYWWTDQTWNNPLAPVVGITWFEAEAYCRWLTQTQNTPMLWRNNDFSPLIQADGLPPTLADLKSKIVNPLALPASASVKSKIEVRLPHESEWEAAMSGRSEFPWGDGFDPACLNCAESWFGREFKDDQEWIDWINFEAESRREASTTAVTTYPQGVSLAGVWDGSGNVWEWMGNPWTPGADTMVLRGGSWYFNLTLRDARVSARDRTRPDGFYDVIGLRVVVAPVFP